MEYLKTISFFLVFLVCISLLGNAICKKERSLAFKIIFGYCLYNSLIAIGGIPIQQLGLPWKYFVMWMAAVMTICLIIIIFGIIKGKFNLSFEHIKTFLKDNWFVVFIVILLAILSLTYLEMILWNNMNDDGYYMNKIASLPFSQNPFWDTPGTGFARKELTFSKYGLNTYEAEAAFFTSLLHIDVTVFTRFGLATFNYLLFIISIIAVIKRCMFHTKYENYTSIAQFIAVVIVLFTTYDYENTQFLSLYLKDAWQFTSAMYYGSSIVRTSGLFMYLLVLISNKHFSRRTLYKYGLVTLALLSKSTVVIPVAIMMALAGIFLFTIRNKNIRFRIISLLYMAILIFVAYLIPVNSDSFQVVSDYLIPNLKNVYFLGIVGAFIALSIINLLLNYRKLSSCNITLLFLLFMIAFKPTASLVQIFSVYGFVAARFLTSVIYGIAIMLFVNILFILFKFIKPYPIIYGLYMLSAIGVIVLSATSNSQKIVDAQEYLKYNPNIVPQSTMELGLKLEKLYKQENKQMNVLSKTSVQIDEYPHRSSLILRNYAPHINNISAVYQYGFPKGYIFSTYKKEDYSVFSRYIGSYDFDSKLAFFEQLKTYPINVLIVTNPIFTKDFKSLDYELYDTVKDKQNKFTYYIFYNKTINTEDNMPADYGDDTLTDFIASTDQPENKLTGLMEKGSYTQNNRVYYHETYYQYDEAKNRYNVLIQDDDNNAIVINKTTKNNMEVYTVRWYVKNITQNNTDDSDYTGTRKPNRYYDDEPYTPSPDQSPDTPTTPSTEPQTPSGGSGTGTTEPTTPPETGGGGTEPDQGTDTGTGTGGGEGTTPSTPENNPAP